MRKLMNKIDRFCYAHPRFGIPNLMLIIVIGNAAVWLLTKMDTTGRSPRCCAARRRASCTGRSGAW